MIPKLYSYCKNPKKSETEEPHLDKLFVEHLFILYALELIKQAKLGQMDQFIASQYAFETHSFPAQIPELTEHFLVNHKEVLFRYLVSKYCDLLDEIIQYMKIQYTNPECYLLAPLSPELRRSVLMSLDEVFPNGPTDYQWMGLTEKGGTIEVIAGLLENQPMINHHETNMENWDSFNPRQRMQLKQATMPPDLLGKYLKQLPDTVCDTWISLDSIQSQSDISQVESLIKAAGRLLTIFAYMVKPKYLVSDVKEHLYEQYVQSSDVAGTIGRYQHLDMINLNNVVCATDEIFYNQKLDILGHAPTDNLVERYLVLAIKANHEA